MVVNSFTVDDFSHTVKWHADGFCFYMLWVAVSRAHVTSRQELPSCL